MHQYIKHFMNSSIKRFQWPLKRKACSKSGSKFTAWARKILCKVYWLQRNNDCQAQASKTLKRLYIGSELANETWGFKNWTHQCWWRNRTKLVLRAIQQKNNAFNFSARGTTFFWLIHCLRQLERGDSLSGFYLHLKNYAYGTRIESRLKTSLSILFLSRQILRGSRLF